MRLTFYASFSLLGNSLNLFVSEVNDTCKTMVPGPRHIDKLVLIIGLTVPLYITQDIDLVRGVRFPRTPHSREKFLIRAPHARIY